MTSSPRAGGGWGVGAVRAGPVDWIPCMLPEWISLLSRIFVIKRYSSQNRSEWIIPIVSLNQAHFSRSDSHKLKTYDRVELVLFITLYSFFVINLWYVTYRTIWIELFKRTDSRKYYGLFISELESERFWYHTLKNAWLFYFIFLPKSCVQPVASF